MRALVGELLDFVAETAEIFKSHDDLDRIRAILAEGSSADRQLAVYAKNNSFNDVVDDLIAQSMLGA